MLLSPGTTDDSGPAERPRSEVLKGTPEVRSTNQSDERDVLGLENDLIPYGMALGNRAYLSGLNIIGLQRRGFSREDIHKLRRAYRLLFADEGTLMERLEDVASEYQDHTIVQEIVAFIRQGGKRSLCTPRDAEA